MLGGLSACVVVLRQHLVFAGGQSSLADYCTYFVAYSDGSCTDINSARAPDRMLGEVRGSYSRYDFLCAFFCVIELGCNWVAWLWYDVGFVF